MPRDYSKRKISKTQFLTAGASPEMQNAQADSRDNSASLASEALGNLNKQLYEYINTALQTSLQGIIASGTAEFEKLSQQIYSNIVDIIEDKTKDGDIAQAMIDNLDYFKDDGKAQETTPKQEKQEAPQTPIEVDSPPVEVDRVHETITQTQEHVIPTKEIVNKEQLKTEKIIEEVAVPVEQEPAIDPAIVNDLRNKLKLLFIYLRSQKMDVFKLLAGVDESLVSLKDKREEIDLDYEEELRERKNQRKAFNRQLALESAWYEKMFGDMEQEIEDQKKPPEEEEPPPQEEKEPPKEEPPKEEPVKEEPIKEQPVKEEPTPKEELPKEIPEEKEPPKKELPKEEPPKEEPKKEEPKEEAPKKEPPKKKPPKEKEEPPVKEKPKEEPPKEKPQEKEQPQKEQPPKEEPKKEEPPKEPAKEPPLKEQPKEEKPKAPVPEKQPPKEPPKKEPPKAEPPSKGKGKPGPQSNRMVAGATQAKTPPMVSVPPSEQPTKIKPQKKVGFFKKTLGKVAKILKGTGGVDFKSPAPVIIIVPTSYLALPEKATAAKKGKKAAGPPKAPAKKKPQQPPPPPKKPSLVQRAKNAVKNVKAKLSVKGLIQKAKAAIAKRWNLAKFKRDKQTKYFKYAATIHVKNKKSIKLWGQEMKFKRLTKKIARELGIQDQLQEGNTPETALTKVEPRAKSGLLLKRKEPKDVFDNKMFSEKMPVPPRTFRLTFLEKLFARKPKEEPEKKESADGKKQPQTLKEKLKGAVSKKVSQVKAKAKAKITQKAQQIKGKVKSRISKALKPVKKRISKIKRKVVTKVKKFTRKVFRKVKKTAKRVGKKIWGKVKKVGKRLWGKAKKVGKKVWKKTKVVAKKVWKKAKVVGKKVWKGLKKVGKKVWGVIKKIAKKVAKAVLKVAVKVAKAAWKGAKKVSAAVWKTGTKLAVQGTRLAGRALQSAGNAVTAIPFVGWVLGPIITGIGAGLTALSGVLRAAFAAIGKAAKVVTKIIEKAVASFMKALSKMQKGGKKAGFGDVVANFKKLNIKGIFTAFARMIKQFTAKVKMGALTKMAMSKIRGLSRPLKFPKIKFSFKPKWGSSSIRKQTQGLLEGIYNRSMDNLKNATSTAYGWIGSIMNQICGNMAELLGNIGQRLSVIATVGFKGFFKALFSPAFLIPLGIILLLFFREKIFGWLKGFANLSLGAIFQTVKKIGTVVWKFLKGAGKLITDIGKWIWRQSNPNVRWTIGWFLTSFIAQVVFWIKKVKRWIYAFVPGGKGSAFLQGAALGGFPWPLYGAILAGVMNKVGEKIRKFIKSYFRTVVGIIFWWLPTLPVNLFNKMLRVLHLDDVQGLVGSITKSTPKGLDEVMTKLEDNEKTVAKLGANLGAIKNINPALKEVGLPDLDKFNKAVTGRAKEGNEAVTQYTKFIEDSAQVLTDPNKAPGVSPGFYNSEKVAEALLSVFFFKDPLSGNIMSMIPKSNIPGIVQGIQKVVMSAAQTDNPKALAQANLDVLNYFDYMNRGRNTILGNIIDKYNTFIDKLANSQGDKQKKIATDFANKMKKNEIATAAIGSFVSDMQVKAGKKTDSEQAALSSQGTLGKGDLRSGGAMTLLKASNVGAGAAIEKAKKVGAGEEGKGKNAFLITNEDLAGKQKTRKESHADKYRSWQKYMQERAELIKQGKSEAEIKKLGYGMNYSEWNDQYEKNRDKIVKDSKIQKPKVPAAKGGTQTLVKPKIVLPQPKFVLPKEQVKISLPGLTREVKEGTKAFDLYKMNITNRRTLGAAKGREKAIAWQKYTQERAELIKQGKSEEEIKKLGYGMNYAEWNAKYQSEKGEKPDETKKEQKEQEGQEKEVEKEQKQPQKPDEPVKESKMPGDFAGVVKKLNKLQKEVKNAFKGLRTSNAIHGLKIKKADGSEEELNPKPKKKGVLNTAKSFVTKLKDKVIAKGKEALGIGKENDKDMKEPKMKGVADMMNPSPETADITVQETKDQQEKRYKTAGISMVSEAQWVSAQEAHKLEEHIIKNAKDVRDIIEGLNVMGDNLDNAKLDLRHNLEEMHKHPEGSVISLPMKVIPGGMQIAIPEELPAYDPLPPI